MVAHPTQTGKSQACRPCIKLHYITLHCIHVYIYIYIYSTHSTRLLSLNSAGVPVQCFIINFSDFAIRGSPPSSGRRCAERENARRGAHWRLPQRRRARGTGRSPAHWRPKRKVRATSDPPMPPTRGCPRRAGRAPAGWREAQCKDREGTWRH